MRAGDPLPFPGMPSAPTKREVASAVVVFTMKYRVHYHILPTEQLTRRQCEEIIKGFRRMLYEYEELNFMVKDPDEDDE